MLDSSENTNLSEAFEIMGQWVDPATKSLKSWVRFYCVDSAGNQVGHDAFSRFFDSIDLVLFTSFPQTRRWLSLQPQED